MDEASNNPTAILSHLAEALGVVGVGPPDQIRELLRQFSHMSDGERLELIGLAHTKDPRPECSDRKAPINVTLTLPVKPEFQVLDEGPADDKGCQTLVLVTLESEINICFDSHDRQYLNELGKAITAAGGVKATGELGFGRDVFNGVLADCHHQLEADTIEAWTPAEAK